MEVSKIMIIALIGIPVIFFVLSLVVGTESAIDDRYSASGDKVSTSEDNASTIEQTASGN